MNYLARKIYFFMVSILPDALRIKFLRSSLNLASKLPSDIQFKLADTKEEIEQAFQILHENFVDRKFMDPEPWRLRITKYHALPCTSIIVGKIKDKVVATLSIIRDNPLGLPLDSTWNISFLRDQGKRIAEISSLAIRKDGKIGKSGLLFPLCVFMFQYCRRFGGIDSIVISTHALVGFFYRDILLFKAIEGLKAKSYGFVKGTRSVAQYLDISGEAISQEYEQVYGKEPDKRNLHKYAFQTEHSAFCFPERSYYRTWDPPMNPETLRYFFMSKARIFWNLRPQDRDYIRSFYDSAAYTKFLMAFERLTAKRKSFRFGVACHGIISYSQGFLSNSYELLTQNAFVRTVSSGGVELCTQIELELKKTYILRLAIGLGKTVNLKIMPLSSYGPKRYGCQLVTPAPTEWKKLLHYLEQVSIQKGPALDFEIKMA